MTEFEKLERYLVESNIPHIRHCIPYFDADGVLITGECNQIIVFDRCRNNMHGQDPDNDIAGAVRSWDAICYRGSYGYKDGRLEVAGNIVKNSESQYDVEGWLTAEDIIKRLEGKNGDK